MESKLIKLNDSEYFLISNIINDNIALNDILFHNESGRIIVVNEFGNSNGSKTIKDTDIRNPIELVINGNSFKKIFAYYSNYLELPVMKLSIENCMLIENGYDLDELAKNKCTELTNDLNLSVQDKAFWCGGFQHGVISNIAENKLSKEEVENHFKGLRDCIDDKDIAEFYIQLAITMFSENNPTEWNVIIESYIYSEMDGRSGFSERRYKLDENGCLILKRK